MSVKASSHDPGGPVGSVSWTKIGSIPMATFSSVFEIKSGDVTNQV